MKKKIVKFKKEANFVPDFSNELEDNMIKAVLTTFGNKDKVGDIMEPNCLDKFITKFDAGETDVIRMLFNHNRNDILGKWTKFEKKNNRIIGYGKFSNVTRAHDIKTLINDGIINSVSIGFKALDYCDRDDADYPYAMNFKEIELYETSIVDMPANTEASIIETKDYFDARFLEKILVEQGFSQRKAKVIISNVKKDLEAPIERDVGLDEQKILNAINSLRGELNDRPNRLSYRRDTITS